jgi:hypothetical protein
MEWESKINTGWSQYTETTTEPGNQPGVGGFMVGVTTQISVIVTNNNIPSTVSNVRLNFSIWDYYGGIPLIKIPTQVSFNAMTATTTVTFDFTPPSANILYIAAYIDYPSDTNKSNNGIAWYGMTTLIWTSDFEDDGYGYGSQEPNEWTGDLGPENKWHLTNTAPNQNSPDHTKEWSWYHGEEDGTVDTYDDSVNLSLESPNINMGNISDGQEEVGTLPEGYFYIFAIPTRAGLITGEAENGDFLWCFEYTDDNGTNWKEPVSKYLGGYIQGDWETQNGNTLPTWHPHAFPFRIFVGDGSGGLQPSNGAHNFSHVRFRAVFKGDKDGTTYNLPGFYADDFITYGYQHWLPPYNIRLSEVSNVISTKSKIPIIHPGVECTFETTIENMGEDLKDIPVSVEVKDAAGNTLISKITKIIPNLDTYNEVKLQWALTFNKTGDYFINIEAGDLARDYTPLLNVWTLKVYVREPKARVLVVDDDNSIHNNGIFIVNVETRMLQSLDDLDINYNVYNVPLNESGPTKNIMDSYEAVIWLTGIDNEYTVYHENPSYNNDWGITLKPEDQIEITDWLHEGDKNFWLISPGVIYDLSNTDKGTSEFSRFLKDYLHLDYVNANETTYQNNKIKKQGTPMYLEGESGSLAAGAKYKTYDAGSGEDPAMSDMGGYFRFYSPYCKSIFPQDAGKQNYNSLQYSRNYNLVYFAFNYYMINSAEDRKDLTYRVLHFFGMVGGVKVDLKDDLKKNTTFGETVSFKYEVTNLALIPEILNLKLVTPSPDNIPRGWSVTLNDKSPTAEENNIWMLPATWTQRITGTPVRAARSSSRSV